MRAPCSAAMSAPDWPTARRALPTGSLWRRPAPCRKPRILIAPAAVEGTRLIRPGELVAYDYRLRLAPQGNTGGNAWSDAASWIRAARAAFPEAGWQLRSGADASPALQRFIDRVGFFLSLVGITALLVGGGGLGKAVARYVAAEPAA